MKFLRYLIPFLFALSVNNFLWATVTDDPDNMIPHNQPSCTAAQHVFSNLYLVHCILLHVDEDDLSSSYSTTKTVNKVMANKSFWFEYLTHRNHIGLNKHSSNNDFNKHLDFFLKGQLILVQDYYQYLSTTGTFYASGKNLEDDTQIVSIFDMVNGVRKMIKMPLNNGSMIVNKINPEDNRLWGIYRNVSNPDDIYWKTYKCFVNRHIEPEEPIICDSTKNIYCVFTSDIHVDFYKHFSSEYEITAESVDGKIILGTRSNATPKQSVPFLVFKDAQGHYQFSDCFVNFSHDNDFKLNQIKARHLSRDGQLIAFTVTQKNYSERYLKFKTFLARIDSQGIIEDLIDYGFFKMHSFSYDSQSAVGIHLDDNKDIRILRILFKADFKNNILLCSKILGTHDNIAPRIQAVSRDHRVIAFKLSCDGEQYLWIRNIGLLTIKDLLVRLNANSPVSHRINLHKLHAIQISDCGSVISFKRNKIFDMDHVASSFVAVLPELLPSYFNLLKRSLTYR